VVTCSKADISPELLAPGEAGSAQSVADLCADTKREDKLNADQLDALIAELKGQTTVH